MSSRGPWKPTECKVCGIEFTDKSIWIAKDLGDGKWRCLCGKCWKESVK
jgi:hypothetical protein